jgi:protein gp37
MTRELFTPPAEVRPALDLAALAARINAEHEAGERAIGQGLQHYRRAGDALLKAKAQCGHGEWLPWLKKHARFPQQRASEYMRLAAGWDKLPPGGNLALKAALDSISEADGRSGAGGQDAAAERNAPGPDPGAPPGPGDSAAGRNGPGGQEGGEPDRPDESLGQAGDGEEDSAGAVTVEQWQAASKAERKRLLAVDNTAKKYNYQAEAEGIKWALWSWNPLTGCLHNCPYCYAKHFANRLYQDGPKFAPALWPDRLKAPRNTPFPRARIEAEPDLWKRRALGKVFLCSLADLFGRWVPKQWIDAVLAEVRAAPQWTFLLLTKFPIRMAEFDFPENAWVGTTVDCQARVANAERAFRKVKAGVKWLSCEPLLEPLKFTDLGAFQWVVLGGASQQPGTPPFHPPLEWVAQIDRDAREAGCRVFWKPNLLAEPPREYPGDAAVQLPAEAPEALRYLPNPEAKA